LNLWKLVLGLEPLPRRSLPTKKLGWWKFPLLSRWIAIIRLKWLFPLGALRRNSCVFGKSGFGKSYLLYLLFLSVKLHWGIWQWIPRIHTRRSFILFDPHGELAQKCAREKSLVAAALKVGRTRTLPNLVFLSPTLDERYIPALNPFDRTGKKDSAATREVLAQYLTKAFAAMISRNDALLSFQMETLLTPMMTVLLAISAQGQPVTLFDLQRFLQDDKNDDLVTFGAEKIKNPGLNQFFRETFNEPRFAATKFSLRVKLSRLLNSRMFVRLLCQERSSWDLEQLMNSGKTILIDGSVAEFGREVTEMYGRTITALAQSYAFLRARKPQRKFCPVFFLVDEAASFISSDVITILTESRKFGLHLVLCQQMVKQGGMSQELHDAIMGNTTLKIIGNAGSATKRILAQEMDLVAADFSDLPVGAFVLKADGYPARRIQLPSFWLEKKQQCSEADFEALKRLLLKRFYPAGKGPKPISALQKSGEMRRKPQPQNTTPKFGNLPFSLFLITSPIV
jgi:hypothetical protein